MQKDIYIIKNKINEKVYIGQADFAWKRWASHLYESHSKPKLLIDKAIKKYGEENFWYELLDKQVKNYDEREMFWISKYNSIVPSGYNISHGGKGVGFGTNHPNASIKNQELLFLIIDDIKNGEMTFEQISKKYQVSPCVIQGINMGTYYRNENIQYPIRQYFLSEKKYKRLVYSLKYELDKSIQDIANDFGLCSSTVSDINQGKEKKVDWLVYPLRYGKTTNPLYKYHREVKELLLNSNLSFSDIARKFNVAVGTIQAINEGNSWIEDKYQYPIRKEGNPTYKNLSQDQICQIEELLLCSSTSMSMIAKRFSCSPSLIQNINRGKIKKYLNEKLNYPLRHK